MLAVFWRNLGSCRPIRLLFSRITPRASSGLVALSGAWTERSTVIDLREHFVHEAQSTKVLQLEPVKSADNVEDFLTKPLLKAAFLLLRKRITGF